MGKVKLSLCLLMGLSFLGCNHSVSQTKESGNLWPLYGNHSHSQLHASGSKQVAKHGGLLGGLGRWGANSRYDYKDRLVFHDSHVKLWPFYELKQDVISTSVKHCRVKEKGRFLIFAWEHENDVPVERMKRSGKQLNVGNQRVIRTY